MPDEAVFQGFGYRSDHCKKAIQFQFWKWGNHISMVKSVLMADVEYTVSFNGNLDIQQKEVAFQKLASEPGLSLQSGQVSLTNLTGVSLVWGIRDDADLASYGLRDNYTAQPKKGSIILGPITKVIKSSD